MCIIYKLIPPAHNRINYNKGAAHLNALIFSQIFLFEECARIKIPKQNYFSLDDPLPK